MEGIHQTVRVYWNLHRKMYSIQARYGYDWYVVAHAEELMLKNVTFKVSEAGRQRVLRTGVKNVHAYVVGGLIPFVNPDKGRRVSYDPKVFDCFVMPHSMAFYAVEKLPLVTLVSIDRKPAVFGPSGEYEVNDNGFLVKKEI
jgi:hypothetical protein